MRALTVTALLLTPLFSLAAPTASGTTDTGRAPPSRVLTARQGIVTPPPCVAITPAPTEAETSERHSKFAHAFLVAKNLTDAFSYISATYKVTFDARHPLR